MKFIISLTALVAVVQISHATAIVPQHKPLSVQFNIFIAPAPEPLSNVGIPNAQVAKEGAVKETKQVPTKEVTAMDTATNKDEKEAVQIPLANGNIPDTQDANKERSDDAQEVPAKDTTPKKDGKESVEEKKPEEASVTPLTAAQESTILEPKPQSVFMTIEQTLEYNKPVGPGIQPGEKRFIIPVMDYKAAIYRNNESEIAPKTENEPEKPLSEIVLDVSAANDQFFVPEGTKPVIDRTNSTIPKIRAAGGNLRHLQLRIKRFRNKVTPTVTLLRSTP